MRIDWRARAQEWCHCDPPPDVELWHYHEWDGPIGHGWFCPFCDNLIQLG